MTSDTSQILAKEAPPPKMSRRAAATAEVESVRLSEMRSHSERLKDIGAFEWASVWEKAAEIVGGAIVGGLVALIPFLSVNPGPSVAAQNIYLATLGGGVLVLAICVCAAITTHKERADSIAKIRRDYDNNILNTFVPVEELGDPPPPLTAKQRLLIAMFRELSDKVREPPDPGHP